MGKKPSENKKSEIFSINLTDWKVDGIRKKVQGKMEKRFVGYFNESYKDLKFNSRDEMFNAVLDLTLRYCSPLPTDEMMTADTLFLFDKLIDRELYFNGTDKPTNKDREELKLYFLFMLQPFSDDRIKKQEYLKMDKIKKRFNYGTMFHFIVYLSCEIYACNYSDRDRNTNLKNINESFNDIRSDMKEMDTTKSKYTI